MGERCVLRFLARRLPDSRDARRIRRSRRRLARTLLLLAGQARRDHADATVAHSLYPLVLFVRGLLRAIRPCDFFRYTACSALLSLVTVQSHAQEVGWKERLEGETYNAIYLYYRDTPVPPVRVTECLADEGDICYGGDHEDQGCFDTVGCRTEAQIIRFLERLKRAAMDEPAEPYPIAQAVYAHTRLRRTATAVDLAMECSSVEWWCDLLRGLAHHRQGMPERAEEYFRRGLPGADQELACRLAGVGELLRGRDRSAYDALDCASRTEFESRFWWLADPMFSMPGNDRWTEHISRRFELVLHEPVLWVTRGRHPVAHEVSVVRRGQNDSWSRKPGQPQERWAGKRAARYRFTPASALVDGLRTLSYELDAGLDDEGYTPATYGPVLELPAQFARFRQGDSLLVAAATDLAGIPLGPSRTVFVASDAPESFPVVLGPVSGQARPVFAATLAPEPVVISVEAMDDDRGAGRTRRGLLPLSASGLVLSDVLLVGTGNAELPESRDEALALMFGKTALPTVDEVSIYWEVYGVDEGRPMQIAISLTGGGRGLLTRILRGVGIMAETGAAEVSWTEPASGSVHPMALSLDLSGLDAGDYELRIDLSAGDGSTATTIRTFRLEG